MPFDPSARVYLGRQRVVDAERGIFGYELLHRAGPDGTSAYEDPDGATRSVMERVLLQWGMERVVADKFGLINASASLVVRGLHRAMPPEGMIIEMREETPFDDATVDALRAARMEGYHFALDNVGRLGDLERSELLPMASIVKVELTTAHDAEIPRLLQVARERCPGVLVVAEKVETADDFARCVEHGFDLFQGWHFARPEVLERPARPVSRIAAEVLNGLVADAATATGKSIDVDAVERVVADHPSLAFRVLAAVNANAFGLDRSVASLQQAIGLLGAEKLRCLAELVAASGDTLDDEPTSADGAARAQMVATLLDGTEHVGSGVTAALLSSTDRLYGTSLGDLLDELPVTDEIASAILHGHGPVGRALDIARATERDDRLTLDDLAPGRAAELNTMRHAAADVVAARRAEFAHDAG